MKMLELTVSWDVLKFWRKNLFIQLSSLVYEHVWVKKIKKSFTFGIGYS